MTRGLRAELTELESVDGQLSREDVSEELVDLLPELPD
jgi:hypothetical protein